MEYSAYFEGDALNPVFITKKAQVRMAERFIAGYSDALNTEKFTNEIDPKKTSFTAYAS